MFVSKLHAPPSNGTPEMGTGSEYRKWVPGVRDHDQKFEPRSG